LNIDTIDTYNPHKRIKTASGEKESSTFIKEYEVELKKV